MSERQLITWVGGVLALALGLAGSVLSWQLAWVHLGLMLAAVGAVARLAAGCTSPITIA